MKQRVLIAAALVVAVMVWVAGLVRYTYDRGWADGHAALILELSSAGLGVRVVTYVDGEVVPAATPAMTVMEDAERRAYADMLLEDTRDMLDVFEEPESRVRPLDEFWPDDESRDATTR